ERERERGGGKERKWRKEKEREGAGPQGGGQGEVMQIGGEGSRGMSSEDEDEDGTSYEHDDLGEGVKNEIEDGVDSNKCSHGSAHCEALSSGISLGGDRFSSDSNSGSIFGLGRDEGNERDLGEGEEEKGRNEQRDWVMMRARQQEGATTETEGTGESRVGVVSQGRPRAKENDRQLAIQKPGDGDYHYCGWELVEDNEALGGQGLQPAAPVPLAVSSTLGGQAKDFCRNYVNRNRNLYPSILGRLYKAYDDCLVCLPLLKITYSP
ncbi:hypothetical protein CVT26_006541, partial [Gymnopilus dilepis]